MDRYFLWICVLQFRKLRSHWWRTLCVFTASSYIIIQFFFIEASYFSFSICFAHSSFKTMENSSIHFTKGARTQLARRELFETSRKRHKISYWIYLWMKVTLKRENIRTIHNCFIKIRIRSFRIFNGRYLTRQIFSLGWDKT